MAATLSNKQSDYSMPMPQPTVAVRDDDKPAAPCWEKAQKWLNIFVRALALIERLGNGLGTLAFTWATVVLLGGFSTDLKGVDFWYATVIMFLEALRVFSRESRSDDEVLFKTTGSIRLKRVTIGEVRYYLSAGIVMVCLYGTLEPVLFRHGYLQPSEHKLLHQVLLLLALLALAGTVQVPTIVNLMKRHWLLQFIPIAAVLALGGTTLFWGSRGHARLPVVLVVASLLVGCLQYNLIVVCLGIFLGKKKFGDAPAWVRTLVPLVLPVWIAVSVFYEFRVIGLLILLGTLLLGNIQIPVAVARIVIAWIRLSSMDSWMACPAPAGGGDCNEHLAPTMKIFYSMVLSQGALYLVACILEMLFSIRLRRSLARCCGFTCHKGKPIDFYYEYAYDKCMEDGVISPEDLNLTRFAVDSLDSKSRDTKFAALRVLNSLLSHSHEDPSKKLRASDITTSMKAVTTLVSMLSWTSQEHQDIRLFAAKITAEIAGDLRITAIPGAMQMVSSLLDDDVKHKLLKQADLSAQSGSGEAKMQQISLDDSTTRLDIYVEEGGHRAPPNRKGSTTKVAADNGEKSSVRCKILQQLSDMFFAPDENETCKVNDLLPVLGMTIITKLAHDLENCAEISRATGLIPKIVGFINYYTADTTIISEEQRQQMNLIITTSLTLAARLASVEGDIGIALRQKILEQPFLLSYLVEILEDNNGCLERWGPAMVIIAKIAVDDEIRKNIGDFQVMIPKLIKTFLCRDGPSNTCCDREVRVVAGEALAKLTKENTSYCSTILVEKRFDVIEDLKNMLQEDEYAYVAASMLSNLKSFDLGDSIPLPSTLRVVMAKMMNNKDDKQLEALLVLASQLYDLNPKQFANELESHTNARRLVKKLVGTLNSNQKPHPEYQRIRRATVEVTISIVESCPHYATIFREEGMVEALSKAETASLKVEKYNYFLGNAGEVVEGGLLLSDLVVKAKRLMGSTAPISALSVQEIDVA